MMRKIYLLLLVTVGAIVTARAQQTPEHQTASAEKKLNISGYIQGQLQWGEQAAALKVGGVNENPEKSFNRSGIRRGRLKFAFDEGLWSAVFQLDITEKGLGTKDAYLAVKDPWAGTMGLKAGVFDRPFGTEIGYSSSKRESPERSLIFQTLFPEERDLGAMVVLQAPTASAWSLLKLEAGFFAGNGIKAETDSKKDFIGHLSAAKKWGRFAFGAGVSHYNGKVFQGSEQLYTMSGNGFVLNAEAKNRGAFARRVYTGFDLLLSLKNGLGATRLTGEYLFGCQPGTATGSKSPNASTLPTTDTYLRDFRGGYAMLVHDIVHTPLSLAGKYEVYDPNTAVTGDEIGQNGTGAADLTQSTVGAGIIWHATEAVRLTAWYDFNRNEKTARLAGMDKDRNDDVLTLRVQYKF